MKHIMIDMETLGTSASAVILSIGAVRFDLTSQAVADEGFYSSISIESNLDNSRRIQEDTLKWWFSQDKEAQQVFFEPKDALNDALMDFIEWVGPDDHTMWSNGADFDLPMLAHAYSQLQIAPPWKFWNSRCMRTYKNLPGAKDVQVPFVGVKHNALSDAFHQAQTVQAIHAALFTQKTRK